MPASASTSAAPAIPTGCTPDEYTEQEQDDATAAIAWLAAQPWCTGAVGMFGISWGGFNSLQVAARAPEALKAIITLCAADDRYADDAHYMGGCLLNENLIWGAAFLMYNALPPDPEIVGDRWRKMWRERLDASVLFPAHWLRHQRRDAYWKHGSVCEDYAADRLPGLCHWRLGRRLFERGAAAARRPLRAAQGPDRALGALISRITACRARLSGSCRRRCAGGTIGSKGIETGIMDEPMFRAWVQDSVTPQPQYEIRPGRWVAEAAWPSHRIERRRLGLDAAGFLVAEGAVNKRLEIQSSPATGITSGNWCAFGRAGEMPTDQRADDGRSLIFDSEPLEAPVEILGMPALRIVFDSDRPVAQVVVRLNDVFPDGTSARVTYGVLNLTHRNGHEFPEPLVPGERYEAVVRLNDIAHSFPAGNRIRIAIATASWPLVWPAPEPVTLGVHTGASMLDLPVRPPDPRDPELRPFAPPEEGPGDSARVLHPSTLQRMVERDVPTGDLIYRIFDDGGEFDGAALVYFEEIDLQAGFAFFQRYRIGEYDPLSARAEITAHATLRRKRWTPELRSLVELRATKAAFIVTARLTASEGDREIFTRAWDETIPRDLI